MRDYLAYLLRRLRTAWSGVPVCREPRCGRQRDYWAGDFCKLHR
jgi:hypothetical protein